MCPKTGQIRSGYALPPLPSLLFYIIHEHNKAFIAIWHNYRRAGVELLSSIGQAVDSGCMVTMTNKPQIIQKSLNNGSSEESVGELGRGGSRDGVFQGFFVRQLRA